MQELYNSGEIDVMLKEVRKAVARSLLAVVHSQKYVSAIQRGRLHGMRE